MPFSTTGAMFNWNDLVFFLELARQGRLMPAARRLKVDHTTVSRRISELEKDLAIKLFERKPDGFVLTEDGHRLLAIAEKMEVLGLSVGETIKSAPSKPSGRVRLATMEGIAAYYLTEKLVDFNAQHPEILVELVTERHLINLTKREADVSISFVPPVGPRLDVRKAGTFKLGLFGSAAYLARRGTPAKVEDLPPHDFVDYVRRPGGDPQGALAARRARAGERRVPQLQHGGAAERASWPGAVSGCCHTSRPRRNRGWCRCCSGRCGWSGSST